MSNQWRRCLALAKDQLQVRNAESKSITSDKNRHEITFSLFPKQCLFNIWNWNLLSERIHSYKQTLSKRKETALSEGLEFLPCNSTCIIRLRSSELELTPWGYQAGNTKTSPETNSHTEPSYSDPFHSYLLSLVRLLAFAFTSLLGATPQRHCVTWPVLAITSPIRYIPQRKVMHI